MDHKDHNPQSEAETQEPLVAPYEELSDDDLDDVAGGWDGPGAGTGSNNTGGP